MDIKALARLAERHRSREERAQSEMLDLLREIDPEVAEQAVYIFHDKTDAARWLASPVLTLGGVTPLQALAAGKRMDVLRILYGILYGLPG